MKRLTNIIFLVLVLCCNFAFANGPDYADTENWAYWRAGGMKEADLFIIAPTVDLGNNGNTNMSLADTAVKANFKGALNMQAGIYADSCRMYAPYYRQAVLADYALPENDAAPYFALAYSDVRAAFLYYLQNENNGRPFVLAGFSQGADMCLRLLKEFDDKDFVKNSMVACYAIGWRLTEDELAVYPQLRPAKGADDLGAIIIFNTEAPGITKSVIVPEKVKTVGINPLNWRTDSKKAPAAMNLGACFTDYSGEPVKEIVHFTGCYLDKKRGTLKVTDVEGKDYPPVLSLFEAGVYHIYDYQFFYLNLQQNVKLRINTFLSERQKQDAA